MSPQLPCNTTNEHREGEDGSQSFGKCVANPVRFRTVAQTPFRFQRFVYRSRATSGRIAASEL
jgi:hypothetical protein